MQRIRIISLFFLSSILITGCGQKTRVKLGFERPDFVVAPPELISRIQSAGDATTYPNSHAIIIESYDSTTYDIEGRADSYSFMLVKPITLEGLKRYSSQNFSYDNQMMDIQILYACIIRANGTVEFVPDSMTVDQVLAMPEIDVYWDNLREKEIRFPQIEFGDAVMLAVRTSMLKPYFEGMIAGFSGFQTSEPILSSRFANLIPKELAGKINAKVVNDPNGWVKFHQQTKGEFVKYVWTTDTVPPFIPEVGMPSATQIIPIAMFSNVSWQEFSRQAFEMTEMSMTIDDAIKQKVDELVANQPTEFDSARAIVYWVSQKVRYVGIALGDKEGITPHDVKETFKASAGVCKDKSALCVAMLRSAGIKAYNVLTNPLQHVLRDVAVNQFNHQIVMFELRDGKKYFADVTDDVCRDMLPGYYSKRSYLVLTREGNDLEYFPLFKPEYNMGIINATTTIDASGNLKSRIEMTGNGLFDEVLRQLKQYYSADDRENSFRQMISRIDPNAELDTYYITPDPVSNLYEPAKLVVEYSVPEYAVVAGDYILLQIPMATQSFNFFDGFLAQNMSLENRHYNLWFMFNFMVKCNETITLPGGYNAKIIPDKVSLDNDYLSFNAEYNVSGRAVTYSSILTLKETDIPLKEYPSTRKLYADYENSKKVMLILEK